MSAINSLRVPILASLILLGLASCKPAVSTEDYNQLLSELSSQKSQAQSIDAQYKDLSAKYGDLKTQYDAGRSEAQKISTELADLKIKYEQALASGTETTDLQAEYEELNSRYAAMQTEFNELNSRNAALQAQIDALAKPSAFTEGDIEKTIFAAINQRRAGSKSPPLQWGSYLYGWAKLNSTAMAEQQKVLTSSWVSWQTTYWAAGYNSIDALVNGAMSIWAANDYTYNTNIINGQIKYGAVAVYKSGDIYYITYLGSAFP